MFAPEQRIKTIGLFSSYFFASYSLQAFVLDPLLKTSPNVMSKINLLLAFFMYERIINQNKAGHQVLSIQNENYGNFKSKR